MVPKFLPLQYTKTRFVGRFHWTRPEQLFLVSYLGWPWLVEGCSTPEHPTHVSHIRDIPVVQRLVQMMLTSEKQ